MVGCRAVPDGYGFYVTLSLGELTLVDALQVCIDLPDDELAQIEAFTSQRPSPDSLAVQCYSRPGPSWSIRADHGAVCVCGLLPIRPGVYQTWCLVTQRGWREHGREITAILHNIVKGALATEARRIECTVLETREKARKWYARVGLVIESTMPGFGANGEAACLYVARRGID